MIARRDSLQQALSEIETRALYGATTIVVSRPWWAGLSSSEQDGYRKRAERAGIDLHADSALSGHYVEVRGGDDGPALSTEHPM